jgi:hypothetical protein
MYCGSCLRDNALARELLARRHDVLLLPVYTPTLTDEEKKALTDAIEEFVEIRDKVSKNSAERYKMLAAYYESVISRLNGLLDRLK